MLKSSVGYENLHRNSPLHDKQTLKVSSKSTTPIFHYELSEKNIFPKISVMDDGTGRRW